MSSKVSPRSRKPRASDFIEKAIAEGKPLPLEVLLESMWSFHDEARRLKSSSSELPSSRFLQAIDLKRFLYREWPSGWPCTGYTQHVVESSRGGYHRQATTLGPIRSREIRAITFCTQ